MLTRKRVVHALITLCIGVLALFIGEAVPHSLATKLIDGHVLIDGGDTTGPFLVDVGNLAMRNLTLANASAGQQGAIAVGPNGRLTLDNCVLMNNHAIGKSGGAIDNAGVMTVTYCTLSNNQADVSGGAINASGSASLFCAQPHGPFRTSGRKTRRLASVTQASSLRADNTPAASYASTT